MTADPVKRYLEPISASDPTGEDVSFDPVIDEIREARRADDPTLAQGEWVQALKTSDWNKVITLCEAVLTRRSKDLEVVGWLVEALASKQGVAGLAAGLQVLEGLLTIYWDTLYPRLEDGGTDVRIGRFEWIDANLGGVVKNLPLLPPGAGGHSWAKWQESRDVENLGLKNPELKQEAIREGKLSGEAFDKAVRSAGGPWFKQVHKDLTTALESFNAITALLDHYLGGDSPSMANLRTALEGCELLTRNLRSRFEAAPPPEPGAAVHAASEALPAPSTPVFASPEATKGPALTPLAHAPDALAGRAQAIHHLHEVARFFRAHEPHSPVAPLVERAARWAEMNLESWLAEVVKDEAVLHQLRTLLDFREE